MTAPQNPWSQQQFPPAGHQQFPPQQRFVRPEVPGTVMFASLIGIVVPILSAVLTVISFVYLVTQVFGYLPSPLGALVFTVLSTLGSLVLAALWVVFAFQMRAGRNWARITLAVLAVVWLLYGLYGLIHMLMRFGFQLEALIGQPSALIATVDSSMALVAMSLFLVLVFGTPSNQYFKATSTR